jgi:hypothetical protein
VGGAPARGFREQRHGLAFPDAVEIDPALLFGEPLVARLATFSDAGSAVTLAAIAELDDGELGGVRRRPHGVA